MCIRDSGDTIESLGMPTVDAVLGEQHMAHVFREHGSQVYLPE